MLKKIISVAATTIVILSVLSGCGEQNGGVAIADGKLTVYNSSSDFVITVDSNNFKDTYDTVDIVNTSVNHRGATFITNVSDSGSDYTCTIDEKFQHNDVVHIDAVGTQNADTRYELQGADLSLEIKTSSSNTISMSYDKRLVNVRHVHGEFQYTFSDNSTKKPYQISINGVSDKIADVKIYYNGEHYILSSNGDIASLTIVAVGLGDEPATTTIDEEVKYCKITINADGTAEIQ